MIAALVKPFKGLRPSEKLVAQVAAPPYDVISTEQAKQLSKGNPYSFLHLSKPEIDLPADCTPEQIHQQSQKMLERFLNDQILQHDKDSHFYLYQIKKEKKVHTGLLALFSCQAYDNGLIRKHELTRPPKEAERTALINAQQANLSPVMLSYRYQDNLDQTMELCLQEARQLYSVFDEANNEHCLLRVDNPEHKEKIRLHWNQIPAYYIADGHHRTAAASRVAANNNSLPANYFLAVAFADNDMQILGYHRVIKDLNGMSEDELFSQLKDNFSIEKSDVNVIPTNAKQFGMLIGKQWYQLHYTGPSCENTSNKKNIIENLDATLLQKNILEPLFSISDPRTDKRIDFIGGVNAATKIETVVAAGDYAIAFTLPPCSMNDLMTVADHEENMPPKSTWFEPKLLDGLVGYTFF